MDELEIKIINIIKSLNGNDLIELTSAEYCNKLLPIFASIINVKGTVLFKGVVYPVNKNTKLIISKYYIKMAQIMSAVIRSVQPMCNGVLWDSYVGSGEVQLDYLWKTSMKQIHQMVGGNISNLFKDLYKDGKYEMSPVSKQEYESLMQQPCREYVESTTKRDLFQNYVYSLHQLKDHVYEHQKRVLSILPFLFGYPFTLEELDALAEYTKHEISELLRVKEESYLSALHMFEVFVEKQQFDKTISRITHLEESLNLFF